MTVIGEPPQQPSFYITYKVEWQLKEVKNVS